MEKRLPKPFHLYAVTKTGQVISYHRNKRIILKQKHTRQGYRDVGLSSLNNKLRHFHVHVLVANAYLSKRPKWATQVNHLDGIKHNNHISNLEWSNRKLNGKHASENGLYRTGTRHPKTFFTDEEVRFIKYESKKLGIGVVELARRLKRWKGAIARIRNGDTWKHI